MVSVVQPPTRRVGRTRPRFTDTRNRVDHQSARPGEHGAIQRKARRALYVPLRRRFESDQSIWDLSHAARGARTHSLSRDVLDQAHRNYRVAISGSKTARPPQSPRDNPSVGCSVNLIRRNLTRTSRNPIRTRRHAEKSDQKLFRSVLSA